MDVIFGAVTAEQRAQDLQRREASDFEREKNAEVLSFQDKDNKGEVEFREVASPAGRV